jgi:hypothetical protein
VRAVFLTSGRNRRFKLGAQMVELLHAPRWQLTLPNRPAGEVVRALAWFGPERSEKALKTLKHKLPLSHCNIGQQTLQAVAFLRLVRWNDIFSLGENAGQRAIGQETSESFR